MSIRTIDVMTHFQSQLRPYTKLPICPKCLREAVHLSYQIDSIDVWEHGSAQPPRRNTMEYILCTCLRCAYQWNMETADARSEL